MGDILRRFARSMARLVGLALLGTAVLVSVELILRKLLGISLNLSSEMSSYVLGLASVWGFSFALFERVHIRIDALTRLLPKKACCYADVVAVMGLLIFSLVLTWFGWQSLAESWSLNARAMTPLSTPLWIPQGLWVLGLVFFSVCCLSQTVSGCILLAKKRFDEIPGMLGNPTAEDEAAAEVKPLD